MIYHMKYQVSTRAGGCGGAAAPSQGVWSDVCPRMGRAVPAEGPPGRTASPRGARQPPVLRLTLDVAAEAPDESERRGGFLRRESPQEPDLPVADEYVQGVE